VRENIITNLNDGGLILYWISAGLCLTLMFGAVRMWAGRIWGLLFYAVSKIALVILPIVFYGKRGVASGDLMLALFLLTFYVIYIYVHKYKIE